MKVVNIKREQKLPVVNSVLFDRMEQSMISAGADFEKRLRMVKTVAPILRDKSSNARHLKIIGLDYSLREKVVAIISLGFAGNREALPTLKEQLLSGCDAIKIASAIAISQMRDGKNNEILYQIMLSGFKKSSNPEVKKSIRTSALCLISKKSASIIGDFFND